MNLPIFRARADAGVALGCGAAAGVADPASQQRLSFDVDEGLNLNSFLRDGPIAAHLLLRSGSDLASDRLPAGNSGVGLWFSHSAP